MSIINIGSSFDESKHNTIFGHKSNASGDSNTIIGHYNYTKGDKNIISGHDNKVIGNNNIITGFNINVYGNNFIVTSQNQDYLIDQILLNKLLLFKLGTNNILIYDIYQYVINMIINYHKQKLINLYKINLKSV
jgi:hypothetical protein